MRAHEIDFLPTAGPDEGALGELALNVAERAESWRDRKPSLVLNMAVMGHGHYQPLRQLHELEPIKQPNPAVVEIQRHLFNGVTAAFAGDGCQVFKWSPAKGEVETGKHWIALNLIDLGPLNDQQREALAMPVNDEPSFWKFADAFNNASPQNWPAVRDIGDKQMKLPGGSNPPTFVNVLMRQIEPADEIPNNLEPKKLQAMSWVDMAHYGSWKVAEVFWYLEEGAPQLKSLMLTTLEGGHPQFGDFDSAQFRGNIFEASKEIGRRLKIFGQVEEVPTEFGVDSREPISPEAWSELPAVKDLIETGKLLGQSGLISSPVEIGRLARGPVLPRLLVRLANYSQQAESARERWEPLIDADVITVTGTLGGSKTEMTPKDMVGGSLDKDGKLLLIRVGKKDPDRPSVEAREFLKPYQHLEIENPDLFFRVSRNDDGSYRVDTSGQYRMRRIVGVDHLHRDIKLEHLNKDKIIVIEPEDLDAVGCGVDANDEKSEYAIRQAFTQGKAFFEEHGYWPTAAVFYVPNHGWNAILYALEEPEGNIGPDLGKPFREAIEKGDLVYGTYAEDVTQV